MTPDDRGRMAQWLFGFLARDGLVHCVLGDVRSGLQDASDGVSIAVAHECLAEVPRALARFCREHGVRLVQAIEHEQTARCFTLAWTGPAAPRFLAVDFCSDYVRNGRRFLTADQLLDGRELAEAGAPGAKPVRVPAAAVRFVYSLVRSVEDGELGEGRAQYLSSEWRLDPAGAEAWMRRFWPQADDGQLIARAAESGDWSSVRVALPWYRRALHRAAPLSFAGVIGELRRLAGRIAQRTGVVFAVMGPEGAGKRAVIERVLADLAPVFHGTARVRLRRSLIGRRRRGAPAVDFPAAGTRGPVLSTARLAYVVLDYLLGYCLQVWPLAVRSKLVAFDRYYQDLLVDPARFRYGAPMRLARWGAGLVPRPDLWALLDADAMQARAELPAAESARQRQEYLQIVGRSRDAVVVDAARPLEQVASEIEWALLDFLERRLVERHPDLREHDNPLHARMLLFFCRNRVPLVSRLVRVAFNSDIHCRMPSPVVMPYPYGIVIHRRSVIGERVIVMQQVTIGSKDPGTSVAPTIEDDVYIGAGAKVLGGIRVGRGAVVGANAVVTSDVPPGSTVVGHNRIVRKRSLEDLRSRARAAPERLSA